MFQTYENSSEMWNNDRPAFTNSKIIHYAPTIHLEQF